MFFFTCFLTKPPKNTPSHFLRTAYQLTSGFDTRKKKIVSPNYSATTQEFNLVAYSTSRSPKHQELLQASTCLMNVFQSIWTTTNYFFNWGQFHVVNRGQKAQEARQCPAPRRTSTGGLGWPEPLSGGPSMLCALRIRTTSTAGTCTTKMTPSTRAWHTAEIEIWALLINKPF